jgi:hypothetical protein
MKKELLLQLWYVTYICFGFTRWIELMEQVNVELPDVTPPKDFDDTFQQMIYMEKRMFDLNARFMPVRPPTSHCRMLMNTVCPRWEMVGSILGSDLARGMSFTCV